MMMMMMVMMMMMMMMMIDFASKMIDFAVPEAQCPRRRSAELHELGAH
jgi:hypothetical protein